MASAPLPLERVARARHLGASIHPQDGATIDYGIQAFDELLPGLPRGSVVEIASPFGLARATRLALSVCASVQASSQESWCAWIDPSSSLHAPGVARAGVDLERLLIVRPEASELARIAVRVTSSGVFSLVVVDRAGVPGATSPRDKTRWTIAVRRLALAAERAEATVMLLSPLHLARQQLLPVAMRLELRRPAPDRLGVHLAKDRRGGSARTVSIAL